MLRMQCVGGLFVVVAMLAGPAWGDGGERKCVAKKIRAAGDFSECLARESASAVRGDFESRSCARKLTKKFRKAERKNECPVEGDAETVEVFLGEVQVVLDDAIATGAELPDVIEPECNPDEVNLLDFEFFQNDAGYWCGDATLLNANGTPLESEIFPYPYANYKLFWVNDIQGNDLQTRTLAMYPPLSPERCAALAAAGIPNALGSGVCGENGAGKIYIGDQTASDCSGTLQGVFPIGSTPLFSESTLLTQQIQTYRQEFVEGGVLLLDGITTLQDRALVTNGQIWDPRQPPGLPQLYGSYFDRMRQCSAAEFFAEIVFWSKRYHIPAGETCGLDSANQPSGTTCAEFFDVGLPAPERLDQLPECPEGTTRRFTFPPGATCD